MLDALCASPERVSHLSLSPVPKGGVSMQPRKSNQQRGVSRDEPVMCRDAKYDHGCTALARACRVPARPFSSVSLSPFWRCGVACPAPAIASCCSLLTAHCSLLNAAAVAPQLPPTVPLSVSFFVTRQCNQESRCFFQAVLFLVRESCPSPIL